MWIKLDEGLFYLGSGGINRMEPNTGFDVNQQESVGTVMYAGTTRITVVTTPIERLHEVMNEHMASEWGSK